MFARNGRTGYILKPEALRSRKKEVFAGKERHILQLSVSICLSMDEQMLIRQLAAKIISGQSLPLPSDIEVTDCRLYVETTIFIPGMDADKSVSSIGLPPPRPSTVTATSDSCLVRTKVIAGNAYNPAWNESVRMSFDTYSGLLDICFLKIEVKTAVTMGDDVSVAQYCASLRTLEQGEVEFCRFKSYQHAHWPFLRPGYRYLPLFDGQMSQYLFSTLFVKINLTV